MHRPSPTPCPVSLDSGIPPNHGAHNLKLLLLKYYNYANIFSVKFNFHFSQKSDAVMASKDPEVFSNKLSPFPASKMHISCVKFPGDPYMKLFKTPNLKVQSFQKMAWMLIFMGTKRFFLSHLCRGSFVIL